jgi:tight adherence protein C
MLVSLAPRFGRPSLTARIAPYVVDVSGDARDLLDRQTADPLPVLGAIFGPLTVWLRGRLGSVLGSSVPIARRLRQSGSSMSVDEFRSRQLVWAASAAAVTIVFGVALAGLVSAPIGPEISLILVATVAAFVGRGYVLQREAAARVLRMTKELPTVLEFLTLSLSAGEGILDAIRRIARISHGELAGELATVSSDVSVGVPVVDALARLSAELQIVPLSRAIEQITGALERGTPLADVLRAQAQDARDEAKRELLELSGKKEVAMLVPLVFLILPITIAIAVFPGLFVLQLGFG